MMTQLSAATADSFDDRVAASGNNVYVVWVDRGQKNSIFFRASNDGGKTFGPEMNLSQSANAIHPRLAVSGDNVYVVWMDDILGINQILFSASNDKGQTFGFPPINLSNNNEESHDQQIAASGNNVYVTWVSVNNMGSRILFSASNDKGKNFQTINLTNPGLPDTPNVAASGNNVYVVWVDAVMNATQIFFTSSHDKGKNFSLPIQLSNIPNSNTPLIGADQSEVYVIWKVSNFQNPEQIFFRASFSYGTQWNMPIVLGTGVFTFPQMAVAYDNVYVVWEDSSGNWDVFFRASNDRGNTFHPVKNLSNNLGESQFPQIAAYINTNVYVVWKDTSNGPHQIFLAKSKNKGGNFTNPKIVSGNQGNTNSPYVAASHNNGYVVWMSQPNLTNTWEIFFRAV